jgi:hypothetical protein
MHSLNLAPDAPERTSETHYCATEMQYWQDNH